MPRRAAAHDSVRTVGEIKHLLDTFIERIDDDDLRAQVRSLIPAFHAVRDLGKSLIPPELASSARDRILVYFQRYPLQVIEGDELLVVAGIGVVSVNVV